MKTWTRIALWAVLGVVALVAGLVATGLTLSAHKRDRVVALPPLAQVTVAPDDTSLARGAYLYATRGCVDCHGASGAGRVFVDDGSLKIKGPNISPGPGSVVAAYKTVDWDRTLRHGVKPDGRPVLIMPSEDYNRLTDIDFVALITYVKALPPAAGGAAVIALPLPVRVLHGLGQIPEAATKIDHALPNNTRAVAQGESAESGRYVGEMCKGCHGDKLLGGKIPGGPPDWPPAPRLARGEGSVLPKYPSSEALVAMMRSGKRADGTAVRVMPFESLSKLSDTDLRALYLFLKSQ
ncbi:MAG TPA: c-type cytochrome [Burkholderiaceae bacterium]|nr:c-type cytochrome [Burkholderiaceae bacterium]